MDYAAGMVKLKNTHNILAALERKMIQFSRSLLLGKLSSVKHLSVNCSNVRPKRQSNIEGVTITGT
jgi:hypothetical protein